MTENVYKSNKHQFFFELAGLSLRMILRIFLIFCEYEPHDSYKKNSYKTKSVYSLSTIPTDKAMHKLEELSEPLVTANETKRIYFVYFEKFSR